MRPSLLLVPALAISCGTGRPPPASEPAAADEHRQLRAAIERLERKVEELAARLDRTAAPTAGTQLSVEDRLERLAQHQEELAADLALRAAAAPPAPAPSRRPEPSGVYAVKVAGSPARGPADAPVTLVRSFEFACPYSFKSLATMEDLLKAYPNELRIVYRDFIVHPQVATVPARAACAAHKQGRYREMHDLIWTRAFEANPRDFGVENMERLASELKLDLKRFVKDMDGACTSQVQRDQADLTRLGQRGTPAFWINGRYLSGARPIDDFRAIIDEELAAAQKRIGKGGVTRANYYKKVVLKKGKKKL